MREEATEGNGKWSMPGFGADPGGANSVGPWQQLYGVQAAWQGKGTATKVDEQADRTG